VEGIYVCEEINRKIKQQHKKKKKNSITKEVTTKRTTKWKLEKRADIL